MAHSFLMKSCVFLAIAAPTLGLLEGRWHLLAGQAPAELRSEIDRQLAAAREALEQDRAAQAAAAEQQRAAELAAAEAKQQQELEAQAAQALADEQAQAAEAERAAELAAEREAAKAQHQAEHAEVRHLVGLLRQAQAALERGGTARAARLREEITTKFLNDSDFQRVVTTYLREKVYEQIRDEEGADASA